MKLKDTLRKIFPGKAANNKETMSNQLDNDVARGWSELAELNPGTQNTSFDDLANVPFAGVTSIAEQTAIAQDLTVDINNGLPSEAEDILLSDTSSELQESTSSPEVQAFKNFFQTDMRIKRELMQAAPRPEDDYDRASRMNYAEKAYRTFKDFRSDFARIDQDFDLQFSGTNAFFDQGLKHFALSKYDPGLPSEIYQREFTDLRPDFVEQVKDVCAGYAMSNLSELVKNSQSINELLHAYHSYIMNNEKIMQRVPAIAEKQNDRDEIITLRGDETDMSREIFDALDPNQDIGRVTDIVGAGDHTMMMVRDRGHALAINTQPDYRNRDQIWIEYNIPKLCNVEMIKALPGIAGYSNNGARGRFVVARADLGKSIADFISKVPTDSDMFAPGGPQYRPPQQVA